MVSKIQKKKQLTNINELLNDFLDECKSKGLSKPTLRCYKQSVEYFISYSKLSDSMDISMQTVRQWSDSMLESGVRITSVNHYLGDVRVFLYWLMEKECIPYFKINLIKGQQPKLKYYTDDEIKKLIVKPKGNDSFVTWRSWAIISFLISTGCRVGTLIDIKNEDVDFSSKEISYTHLKTKKIATIPLSSQLEKTIKEYQKFWDLSNSKYLFCDVQFNKLTVDNIRHALQRYFNYRGIEFKGIHTFRHSFARLYVKSGGNAFKLQKILCHSNITTTQKYVQLFSDDLKEGFDNICPLDNLTENKTFKVRRA